MINTAFNQRGEISSADVLADSNCTDTLNSRDSRATFEIILSALQGPFLCFLKYKQLVQRTAQDRNGQTKPW